MERKSNKQNYADEVAKLWEKVESIVKLHGFYTTSKPIESIYDVKKESSFYRSVYHISRYKKVGVIRISNHKGRQNVDVDLRLGIRGKAEEADLINLIEWLEIKKRDYKKPYRPNKKLEKIKCQKSQYRNED